MSGSRSWNRKAHALREKSRVRGSSPDGRMSVPTTPSTQCGSTTCGFRQRRTLILKGTRTALRAEDEQFSERSDAGTFIEGARTGKLENAAFHAAESTLTAVMALQACVTGREMTWDTVRPA